MVLERLKPKEIDSLTEATLNQFVHMGAALSEESIRKVLQGIEYDPASTKDYIEIPYGSDNVAHEEESETHSDFSLRALVRNTSFNRRERKAIKTAKRLYGDLVGWYAKHTSGYNTTIFRRAAREDERMRELMAQSLKAGHNLHIMGRFDRLLLNYRKGDLLVRTPIFIIPGITSLEDISYVRDFSAKRQIPSAKEVEEMGYKE